MGQNNANGSNPQLQNPSESFLYAQQAKNGADSREGTMNGTAPPRAMAMYDREQMQRVGEQDEDGHGSRKRGLWSGLCCRG
jgi:casein kinase 1